MGTVALGDKKLDPVTVLNFRDRTLGSVSKRVQRTFQGLPVLRAFPLSLRYRTLEISCRWKKNFFGFFREKLVNLTNCVSSFINILKMLVLYRFTGYIFQYETMIGIETWFQAFGYRVKCRSASVVLIKFTFAFTIESHIVDSLDSQRQTSFKIHAWRKPCTFGSHRINRFITI